MDDFGYAPKEGVPIPLETNARKQPAKEWYEVLLTRDQSHSVLLKSTHFHDDHACAPEEERRD